VILSTLFIVQKETKVPMTLGFVNVGLNIGLNFALRPGLGVAGIALSTTLTYAILNVLQATAAYRRWGSFVPSAVARSLIAVVVSVALAGAVAELLLQRVPSATSRIEALFVVVGVGGAAALVYCGLLLVARRFVSPRRSAVADLRSGLETQ
jgi:peptidoglycan biosynthesis protein MviN/MurJ (putative lipid II flippase)